MKLRVEFDVTVPDGVSLDEAENWLNYELGASPTMLAKLPMSDYELEATNIWVKRL